MTGNHEKDSARRKAFILDKQRMKAIREFYYQFGQPCLTDSINGDFTVQFEYLHRGVKLEEIPTECAGVKVKVKMYEGDSF